jgi:hypothetical protein
VDAHVVFLDENRRAVTHDTLESDASLQLGRDLDQGGVRKRQLPVSRSSFV